MSSPTFWERVKTGSKKSFDVTWKTVDKLGAPVNRLSNKLGSEAFWPTTLDKESNKAARILKSFCKDGFYTEEERRPQDGPTQKQKVLKKIPAEVIKNAKGLAIFTTMRTGLWISGAGGSGILVGRLPDGSWSPPSGILLHTAGLGFLVGVDIYDCVVVINTEEAMRAFTKIRCTLGSEISVAAGPLGAGGILDTEIHKRQAPILTYLKSRGFYAGVQIDGTVIIERTDENERFYGERIGVQDIISGKVRHPPYELKTLMETIKAAQGDNNFDEGALPSEPPPGDYAIEDGHVFGIPEKEDPDPYGVLALEKEGLSLKEAGTHKRASWEEFSFNPSPSSPVHNIYARNSQDRARSSMSRRSSWRASAFANDPKTPSSLRNSMDQQRLSLRMSDSATQTDFPLEPLSPGPMSVQSLKSRRSSKSSVTNGHMQHVPEHDVLDTSPTWKEPANASKANGYTTPPVTPPLDAVDEHAPEDDDRHDDDVHFEESVVHAVHTVQPAIPQAVSKVRVVNMPKRIPPKLPPRNPNRSGSVVADAPPSFASVPGESATPTQPDDEVAAISPLESPAGSTEDRVALDHVQHPREPIDLVDHDNGAAPDPSVAGDEAPGVAHEEPARSMPGGF